MLRKPLGRQRKGSVLVEYALLIAGVVLVSVVAIAVLGHKVSDMFGIAAAVMPGAHVEDNKPVAFGAAIPFQDDGNGKLVLKTDGLVSAAGTDRLANIIGPGAGELLIKD